VLVIVLLVAAVLLFARNGNSAAVGGSAALVGYQNIQPAVIQIIGEGTFAEPEGMAYNAFGAGSGFIIDPSGIAVTNNHVVTGAAILKVKVGGDQSRTYNAKVLGVSECSDLAVIKIDGGPFPYLDWSPNSPKTGLDVYAAGFPLGEPEYSLTRGIVSKDQLEDLNTSWASIPHAIMHDATINPGNSGGPLVNDEGQVVGVNYAGSNENNQYFAIASDQAKDMISKLSMGRDLETLGINGEAGIISFEDENKDKVYVPGLWISSIKSGSPADLIGIKPKDIIRRLENIYLIPIESNDTLNEIQGKLSMDKYCSILRSRNLTDQMEIEVVRIENGKLVTLEGKINGSPLVRKK
jgi:serine protease Do